MFLILSNKKPRDCSWSEGECENEKRRKNHEP